jgi:predicted metal-dependent peptidase
MAESSSPAYDAAKVQKELIKGIVHLARHKEFYGHIVQQFQKVWVKPPHRIQTAGVGRFLGERFIKMWLNLDFFGQIFASNAREQAWTYMLNVEEHEIIHIVFGHLFLPFEDDTRGGVATDCVVNSILNPQDDKAILPGNYVHPAHYQFPIDKSAMWYYTHLRENDKFKQQCASGKFGQGGQLSHVLDGHAGWKDVQDDPVAQEFAKDIVRKAKDLCGKEYGNIPGRVLEQIDELLKRKRSIVPWGKVLRMFCASAQESILDYTMKKISRRFGTRPGTRKGDVLKLAVAIDTSGSISDEQLKLFWNEIRWVHKNGAEVWVYECDTVISERSPFKFKGKWDGKVHGRGGTDLEPPLAACEGKYDALIYFTDFYAAEIKKRYRIPILWVLTTDYEKDQYPYKWGKHIKIDEGKAVAA